MSNRSVSVEFVSSEEEKDLWTSELWQRGCTGIVETDVSGGKVLLRAFFDGDEPPPEVLELLRSLDLMTVRYDAKDWVAESQSRWEPFRAGERFYLVPEWRDDPTPDGLIRIPINPGMACGTGFHEATQQCIEYLEKYFKSGIRVADIGTGSGILASAALLLGAGRAIGCDEDPVAVEIARGRAQQMNLPALNFIGSATALGSGVADLILCNINAPADVVLAPDCLRALASGGVCVAAGFEIHEEAYVENGLLRAGAAILEHSRKNVWSCFVYTAASGGAGNGPRASSILTAI